MALAEPRRRQKWTLNPRGNLWANDTEKFGLKLMEKMGYEQGKGLGAKKSGILTPIGIRQKSDSKGIGFDGHDDTWLAHQDDFQAVLASLNIEHGNEEAQESGKKSLEKLSKKSKKRVHYQRFTRGKDLANYSNADLGCILGTNSDKLKTRQKEREETENGAKPEEDKTEVGAKDHSHGVVTIQGGNYHEYFQKKMAELRAKGKPTFKTDAEQGPSEESSDSETQKIGFEQSVENGDISTNVEEEQPTKKKKKKSKKEKCEDSTDVTTPTEDTTTTEATTVKEDIDKVGDKENFEGEERKKKKKSKKEKQDKAESQVTENNTEIPNKDDEPPSKKKKKKRQEVTEEPKPVEAAFTNDEPIIEKKKKKKKDKNRDAESEVKVVEEAQINPDQSEGKKSKKKKRDKETVEDTEHPTRKRHHAPDNDDDIQPSNQTTVDDDDISQPPPKKRKKKDKKEKQESDENTQNNEPSSVTEKSGVQLGFKGSCNLLSLPGYGGLKMV